MSNTVTTVTPLGFLKPAIGGDENIWGNETNQNWDLLDGHLGNIQANIGNQVAILRALIRKVLPPGTISLTGSVGIPDGWIACHGQHLSRTEYAELFAVMGTTFGAGDGYTTFRVPDYRGRLLAGADAYFYGAAVPAGVGFGAGPGAYLGVPAIALSTAHLPYHSHSATIHADGLHHHLASVSTNGLHSHPGGTTSPSGEHIHSYDRAVGNGYAGGFGTATAVLESSVTTPSGDHVHAVYLPNDGNHSHTVTLSIEGHHVHGITIDANGGGAAFSILPPLLTASVMMFAGKY